MNGNGAAPHPGTPALSNGSTHAVHNAMVVSPAVASASVANGVAPGASVVDPNSPLAKLAHGNEITWLSIGKLIHFTLSFNRPALK